MKSIRIIRSNNSFLNSLSLLQIIIKITVLLVFIYGISLRSVEVLNGNYLFGFDQGRDYMAVYNIVENHKFTLIGAEVGAGSAGLTGLFHGPGYYYLLSLVYILFRGDPYSGIVLMYLFGIATLGIVFFTVKKMFGMTASVIALFLVSVSPLIAPQSRFVWNHHPTSLFIVIVFYYSYMISKKPRFYTPLAIFVAGIIYNFELAIAIPLVISLFVSLVFIFRLKDIRVYLYSLFATFLAFFPMILFEIRHGFIALRGILFYLTGNTISSRGDILIRVEDHIRSYISNAKDSFIIERGLLPMWVFILASFGLFAAIAVFSRVLRDVGQRKFFGFIFVTLLISYGMFMFLNNSIWDYYLIHAHFVYMYTFTFCLSFAVLKFKRSYLAKLAVCMGVIFLLSMIVSSIQRIIQNYVYDFIDFGGVEKIKGKKLAIDYIYNDAKGEPFSEFTFMAPVYTYPYDFLFKTYAKKKFGYAPGSDRKGLGYMIIEPDGSKPWSYNGWLETVIKGGTIIDTVLLPSGHIIQKRQFPL